MSYQIYIDKEGRSAPRLVCHTCGEVIEDLTLGVTAFDGNGEGLRAARHVHRGACDRVKKAPCWHELSTDLIYLLHDVGWINEKGKATEKLKSAFHSAVNNGQIGP
jgi:hypothetical protein